MPKPVGNMRKRIEAIKERPIIRAIVDEFKKGISKAIGWIVPSTLFGLLLSVGFGFLFPPLEIASVSAEVSSDGQVLSEENRSNRHGKLVSIEDGQQLEFAHHSPTIDVVMWGRGRIGEAYVAYDIDSAGTDHTLRLQKVSLDPPCPIGIMLSPSSCSFTINYAVGESDIERVYLLMLDKETDAREIWCLVIKDGETIETYSEDRVASTIPYDRQTTSISFDVETVMNDISYLHQVEIY